MGAGAVGLTAYWQSDTLEDIGAALSTLNDYYSYSFLTWPEGIVAISSIFGFLAVPILTLLVLTISSLVRRIPLASGLVRGIRNAAVPIACLLTLLNCGLILGTSRQEKIVGQSLNQMQQN